MRKLRNTGVAIDVDSRLPALQELLRGTPGVAAAYVYGSYGTEHQTPLSDVDLAVLFRPGEVPDFRSTLGLITSVTGCLHEDDVSVLVLNTAPLSLQFEVVSKGRRLLVTDEIALADFLEILFDRYGDFSVDLDAFLAEYDRALVEDLVHGARRR